MADDRAQQLTDLEEITSCSPTDILYIVTDPTSNANASFSISVAALGNSIITENTPANSTLTVNQGTIYYDSNYIYLAVTNNTLKRLGLSSF